MGGRPAAMTGQAGHASRGPDYLRWFGQPLGRRGMSDGAVESYCGLWLVRVLGSGVPRKPMVGA